ncbi:MAG: hypothetical protein M5U25_21105 [Planctomycetota bacterium]|nr:hypothetical protein [Planctomycetota bacterium]
MSDNWPFKEGSTSWPFVNVANFPFGPEPNFPFDDKGNFPFANSGGAASAFGLRWSDDFERADSATLGGDWTEDPTYNNFAISGGNLARPGGSFNYAHAWVTSGAAVASAKDRIAIEAKGYGSAGSNYNLGFGMGAAAGQLASVHGYGVWRATGSGVSILRLEADGSPTVLASRSPSGLSSDGSTTTDLKLEIIKDGAAVILRLYENGVQLGADINDATPGDAYGVFTTAYPTVNSNGSAANAPNNPRVGGVEVSY